MGRRKLLIHNWLLEPGAKVMTTTQEYLKQATEYDALALQATKEQRRVGYRNLAEVYRYFAEQVSAVRPAPTTVSP
jgi:hypothetical protein